MPQPGVPVTMAVWLVDTLGRGVTVPIQGGFLGTLGEWNSNVHWSPDGATIAIPSRQGGVTGGDVYLIDVVTGKTRTVKGAGSPSWSPDGHSVAVIGGDSAQTTLDVLDADGSNRRTLGPVTVDESVQIVWAP